MVAGRFDKKVAIITGASSGIGRSVAERFAREGMSLVLAGRDERKLASLAAGLRTQGSDAVIVPGDVTDHKHIKGLVAGALERFGRIDITVCSAGEYIRGPVESRTRGDFERAMAVNFYGAVDLVYAVLPQMLAQRAGHIIVISSVDGKKGLPLDAPYVSAKFAINGFMDVLRQELRGTGVRVTTILPARVDTPMIRHLKVPIVSAKISSDRVAGSVLRSLRGSRAEVIVPWLGPKFLVIMSTLFPRVGDGLVRLFRLEGKEAVIGGGRGG